MGRSKFLGIAYDYWHFVLAIVVTVAFFVIFYMLLGQPGVGMPVGWRFFISVLMGMVFSHHLQSYNEAIQAIDKTVELKYGSWYRFQQNSRRDWMLFYRGLLLSPFICGIIALFI